MTTRLTLTQQAARAGKVFDERSVGRRYALLFGGRVYFARTEDFQKLERVGSRYPGSQILDLRRPTARIQFIAWATKPRRKHS